MLEKRGNYFYQVYYFKNQERVVRKFDITVGSGIRGQTYITSVNNQLIELPVSYFTQVHQWANSPGYPLYPTLFNRPATSRCMECHSTFVEYTNEPLTEPEYADTTKILYGITCERCHGPGAKHVLYQRTHPGTKEAKYIINPAHLSPTLKTDICALCHSGRLQKTKTLIHICCRRYFGELFYNKYKCSKYQFY